MRIPRFELERWQSVWENFVELNVSESGVKPFTLRELLQGSSGPEHELAQLMDARLGYPQTDGSEALRARVAALYPSAEAANVLITCGCAEANFLVAWSLLAAGDEAVILQPNYMQLSGVAQTCGAAGRPVWLREELAWAPDLDELRRIVSPRTKLIAVCNPNNPTGAVLSEQMISEVCAIAAQCGAWILADEVYRGAELEGDLTPTFWGRGERIICSAGMSKAYGLPGLRMGWIVAPPSQIEQFWAAKDYTTIGVSMLSHKLAEFALAPRQRERIFARTRRILRENYPTLGEWVRRHGALLRHVPPRAGAIAWVGYSGARKSAEIAEELRAEKKVLIVPGAQFGMEGFLRVGYGYDRQHLEDALVRMDEVMFGKIV
jgi:aspartate/methionine/tyrosine aminotransferase